MARTTLLITVAVFVVAGGAVILAQNTTVDHPAPEGTRVEAPGTKVETDSDKTRIQAPGVDITVPREKTAE